MGDQIRKLSVIIIFLAGHAMAKDISYDYHSEKPTILKCEQALAVVHPASLDWLDHREVAKKALQKLIRKSKLQQSELLLFIDPLSTADHSELREDYYVNHKNFKLVSSCGGEHNFSLPSGKVVLAGGHFHLCMAEALRDFVRNYGFKEPLQIQVITDATYMNTVEGWIPDPENKTIKPRRKQKDWTQDKRRKENTVTLAEYIDYLGDDFASYLRQMIFTKDAGIAPMQKASDAHQLLLRGHQFVVQVGDAETFTIGSGQKKIYLQFLQVDEL